MCMKSHRSFFMLGIRSTHVGLFNKRLLENRKRLQSIIL